MAVIKHHKYVAALPGTLEANSIYYVRAGSGFDIYVTNSSGTLVAYPLNPNGPFKVKTSSGNRPITLGGIVTFAHGFTVEPSLVELFAVCTVADGVYPVGHKKKLAPYMEYTGQGVGCEVKIDPTNVTVYFGSAAIFPVRSGSTVVYATAGRWELIIEATL